MKTTARALIALVLAGAAAPLTAQDIACEKYTLDNGLTVVLREDHSLPVAAVNIWYNVGAKDEPPGRSGFAHLFEHLMFMGTERVPGGGFDTIMESGGGSNNASTSFDRTNYFSSGPASLLPTLLWLDADRLEDLGRTMDQAKLDRQREVVRNERRQSIENAPYGKSELLITELMFPQGHPYHNEVIGTHEDLESATVQDVKDFFANFYVPRNASLVVAGDFDPTTIKPLIADLFGALPGGGELRHGGAAPVALDRVIRATTLDDVQLARVSMAYHSPRWYADGDAEMDLVAAILSSGKNSRLYKRLVYESRLAADVSAYQASALLQSVFRIDVTAQPGADLAQIERIVDEEVAALVTDGPRAEELELHKTTVELTKLSSLQSIEAVADHLNEYQFHFGEPNSFARDLDRYRRATPATVREWAERVLPPGARVIVRVLPSQPERDSSPRDARPETAAPAPFEPPAPATFNLANGVPVRLWTKKELPLVAVRIQFRPGRPLTTPETAGLGSLMADMLDEGAGDLDALAFGEAMQSLGARLGASASDEAIDASLFTLKRNLPKAASLAADAVRRPRFAPSDWDRTRALRQADLAQQDDEPRIVAGRVGLRWLYGDESPYAWPTDGTPESVERLTLEQVREAWSAVLRPELATIYVSGDVTMDEVRAALDPVLGNWAPRARPAYKPRQVVFPPHSALRLVVVDRPGAVQTVIRFVTPGIGFSDSSRVPYRLLNTLLGGSFTSRLNQNLREAHGYTYGAGSRFTMGTSTGTFIASSSVVADKTGEALGEFLHEFERLRSGDVGDEEAAKAIETVRTDTVQLFAGLEGILGLAAQIEAADLPYLTLEEDFRNTARANAAGLNSLAQDAFPLERGVLVLVGDWTVITEEIKGLPLPTPLEVSVRGDPVPARGDAGKD